METNRKSAMKIWETQFGEAVSAADFAGRKIQKGAYGQITSDYGWCLAYIVPKSFGGTFSEENLICAHVKTFSEKDEDFPSFNANDTKYKIIKENGAFKISESDDADAIAEKEAKTVSALRLWDELLGENTESCLDFCGREIRKYDYGTENAGAWKIAQYVSSKPRDAKNVYIANILTVEEALGKTAFKANGNFFTLNKDAGAYSFRETVQKTAKKSLDLANPAEVSEQIEKYLSAPDNKSVCLDFLSIKAVFESEDLSERTAAFCEMLSSLIKESAGDFLSFELLEKEKESLLLMYRFSTPRTSDLERIFNTAVLLNTYSEIISRAFGLVKLKIYNYANYFESLNAYYSVKKLSEINYPIKSFVSSICNNSEGFHENEKSSTVYASEFIVYNVSSLSETLEKNVYYTETRLAEFDVVFSDIKNEIDAFSKRSQNAYEEEIPSDSNEPSDEKTNEINETSNECECSLEHFVETVENNGENQSASQNTNETISQSSNENALQSTEENSLQITDENIQKSARKNTEEEYEQETFEMYFPDDDSF